MTQFGYEPQPPRVGSSIAAAGIHTIAWVAETLKCSEALEGQATAYLLSKGCNIIVLAS